MELIHSDKSLQSANGSNRITTVSVSATKDATNTVEVALPTSESIKKPPVTTTFDQNVIQSSSNFSLPPIQKLPPLSNSKSKSPHAITQELSKDSDSDLKLDDLGPQKIFSEEDSSLSENVEATKSNVVDPHLGILKKATVISHVEQHEQSSDDDLTNRPLDLSKKSEADVTDNSTTYAILT